MLVLFQNTYLQALDPNIGILILHQPANEPQTLSQKMVQLRPEQRGQLICQHLVDQPHPPPGSLFDQEGSK